MDSWIQAHFYEFYEMLALEAGRLRGDRSWEAKASHTHTHAI